MDSSRIVASITGHAGLGGIAVSYFLTKSREKNPAPLSNPTIL
jgi:hypothetical protein